jgi:hypothetical protein
MVHSSDVSDVQELKGILTWRSSNRSDILYHPETELEGMSRISQHGKGYAKRML